MNKKIVKNENSTIKKVIITDCIFQAEQFAAINFMDKETLSQIKNIIKKNHQTLLQFIEVI